MDKITFYGSWSLQIVRVCAPDPSHYPPQTSDVWFEMGPYLQCICIDGNIRPNEADRSLQDSFVNYLGYDGYYPYSGRIIQISGQQWDLHIIGGGFLWYRSLASLEHSASYTIAQGLRIDVAADRFLETEGTLLACTCLDPSISLPPLPADPIQFTLPEDVRTVGNER